MIAPTFTSPGCTHHKHSSCWYLHQNLSNSHVPCTSYQVVFKCIMTQPSSISNQESLMRCLERGQNNYLVFASSQFIVPLGIIQCMTYCICLITQESKLFPKLAYLFTSFRQHHVTKPKMMDDLLPPIHNKSLNGFMYKNLCLYPLWMFSDTKLQECGNIVNKCKIILQVVYVDLSS